MEQTRSTEMKIRWTIGKKLVATLAVLLVLTITVLSYSNILLFTGDRRAYTYQSQATQSALVGRELSSTVRTTIDTLRLMLGSIDPSLTELSIDKKSALQAQLENQSLIFHFEYLSYDAAQGHFESRAKAMKSEWIRASGIDLMPELINQEKFSKNFEHFKKTGVLILGEVDTKQEVVGVMIGDLKYKPEENKIPIGIGLFSIADLKRETRDLGLTLATMEGALLFTNLEGGTKLDQDPLFQAIRSIPLQSGTREFEHGGEKFLGAYSKPGFDLVILTRTPWRTIVRATFSIVEKFIMLGVAAICAALVLIGIFSKILIARPIESLYAATREVSAGNFNLTLKSETKDELGALTHSFNAMSKKITELISESMKRVQLENELKIASTVQATLIPEEVFADEKIEIHSRYASATECGGDWWGMFRQDQRLCIMIADATGHGLPSALITAAAHSCFSVIQKMASEIPGFDMSPGALLNIANRAIYDSSKSKIMMTFFIGVIDFSNNTIKYSSAGHNPPWVFRKDGDGYQLKSLIASGQRLGEERDSPPYEEKEIEFTEGDLFFLYTDGLMDAMNRESDKYGKKRVRAMIERGLSEKRGVGELCAGLMSDLRRFNGAKPFDDDVTIVFARHR